MSVKNLQRTMCAVFLYTLFFFNLSADDDLSLGSILDLEVEVATKSKQKLREAPSIVSVITAEQIKNIGARDLIDVLRLIPGYTFAQDVLGVSSIVSRGLYAQEGKILVAIDGVEMNDVSYGVHSFGQHFPVELIEKIEIIRGPGSALYGGFAELGVINIKTKSGTLDGHELTSTVGKIKDLNGTRAVTYAFGKQVGEAKLHFNAKLNYSDRAQGTYVDNGGVDKKIDNSRVEGRFINSGIEYKGFKGNILQDRHSVQSEILWGEAKDSPFRKNFDTTGFTMEYKLDFTESVSLTPYYSSKEQKSWWQPDADIDVALTNDWRRFTDRTVYGGLLRLEPITDLELTFGSEKIVDESQIVQHFGRNGTEVTFGSNSKRNLKLEREAYFFQGTYNSESFANLTLGGRYETATEFENTFVPRFGLTKVFFDELHAKLLYSHAYRFPSLENYDLNTTLKPETTKTLELEVGYKMGSNWGLTANLFKTTIEDIIVYYYNSDADTEHYYNYKELSSNGLELEAKFAYKLFNGALSATYQKISKNEAKLFKSSRKAKRALGQPELKLTSNINFTLMKGLNLNWNTVYEGKMYAIEYNKTLGETQEKEVDSKLLIGLFANYNLPFYEKLNLGLGVQDLLDDNPPFHQAANNGAMPYPGPGRELYMRLTFTSPF